MVMGSCADREAEMHRRHEEILIQREAILRGTERYYDSEEAKALSFISNFRQAKQRNQNLQLDIARLDERLKKELDMTAYKDFNTLKTNYWSMVRNVFPLWYDEQKQWEKRHGSPRFARSPRHSPVTSPSRQLDRSPYGTDRVPTPPRHKNPLPYDEYNSHYSLWEQKNARQNVSSTSPRISPRKTSALQRRPMSQSPDSSHASDHHGPVYIPPLDLDPSMGEDVTTLSQVSAIPQSAHAQQHVGLTPTGVSFRGTDGVTYVSYGVETESFDTRQIGIQTRELQATSPDASIGDVSDNWAYTSHTPRGTSPKGKSEKTPRGKSPRAKTPTKDTGTPKSPKVKTPKESTTPKSALSSGTTGKGKGKKVQIKEDQSKKKK